MHKLTKMITGVLAATGIITATITPASAADNGAGWATAKYDPATGMCQLEVASGSRAEAQINELRRIYIAHFTGANTDMRNKVAADMGITPAQVNNRQYSDADAQKIGMTKAQLQKLHDQLNRKGAVEFLIATGASYYGTHDSQRTTDEQVKYLKHDRDNGLGRGVYWVTNDAGRVDYVPPQPVKDYFQKRLLGSYKQVLIDKQRGAELSNHATQMCYKSRHNNNVSYGVPIGLLGDIHKYNPSWKNPPTLQMKAADKKNDSDNGRTPIVIVPQTSDDSGTGKYTCTKDCGRVIIVPQEKVIAGKHGLTQQHPFHAMQRYAKAGMGQLRPATPVRIIKAAEKRHALHGIGKRMKPMSLQGGDYISDPTATITEDGSIVNVGAPTQGDENDSGSSGFDGLFGSS